MTFNIEKYKGIHPGAFLERELKKKKLHQRPFAFSIEEYPQTINAITKQKRGMNTPLALKIEQALGMEEGTMMMLQIFYDIAQEKQKHIKQPDLSILRSVLFWDTEMSKINWQKQYKAVIKRVFERGNQEERDEISRFYGNKMIHTALGTINSNDRISLQNRVK